MFSDQTGEFPFISSRGNKFIMLVHHVDSKQQLYMGGATKEPA